MSASSGETSAAEPFEGAPTGTLLIAVHGILQLNGWIAHAIDDGTLDEDAFSLVVKRTVTYGLGSFVRDAPSSAQWAHHDAGGDWTQDGSVRELAWLQVALPAAGRQRIPIQPAARVLGDALHRVGRFELTGLHTVVPMALATDSRAALAYAAGWFALADPAPSRRFTVTVYGEPMAGPVEGGAAIPARAQELTDGLVDIEASEVTRQPFGEVSRPRAGDQQTAGMIPEVSYLCTAREWSLDTATWATEVFVEALRETGTKVPTLITVSIA